jgi:hypothetical protein
MSLTRDGMMRCDGAPYYYLGWDYIRLNRRDRPPKLSRHAKVTAHPAIGLFSDYIREGARTAMRKEK